MVACVVSVRLLPRRIRHLSGPAAGRGQGQPHSPVLARYRWAHPERFRFNVWLPALKVAGLEMKVRIHDLRHAHATVFRDPRAAR
jgi:hypothetical protein